MDDFYKFVTNRTVLQEKSVRQIPLKCGFRKFLGKKLNATLFKTHFSKVLQRMLHNTPRI